MTKLHRLLKLHKLYKPAGDDGSDTGGTDVVVDDADDAGAADDAGDGSQDGETTGEDGADPEAGADGEVLEIVIEGHTESGVDGTEDELSQEEYENLTPKQKSFLVETRKRERAIRRELRDLKAKMEVPKGDAVEAVLGEKPTLASCDFDEAKFESDLEAWHVRKREIDERKREVEIANQRAQESWRARQENYSKAAKSLRVNDFSEAEDVVKDTLSIVQQGIILKGLDKDTAARMIYALGKNPRKLKEIAANSDPIDYAIAIGELKTMLKVTPRKAPPPPERTVRGGGQGSAVDSQLERLQAEADKTGDRSKVARYLRDRKTSLKAA